MSDSHVICIKPSNRFSPIVLLNRVLASLSLEKVLSGEQLDTESVTPIFSSIPK